MNGKGWLTMQPIKGEEKVEVALARVQPQTIHMRNPVNDITAKELSTPR